MLMFPFVKLCSQRGQFVLVVDEGLWLDFLDLLDMLSFECEYFLS